MANPIKTVQTSKKDWKSYAIIVMLVVSIITNVWLTYSVVAINSFMMQFVQDVFYYQNDISYNEETGQYEQNELPESPVPVPNDEG